MGLGWPDDSTRSVEHSILAHCRMRSRLTDKPMDNDLRITLLKEYQQEMRSARFELPPDFMQFSHFKRVCCGLDYTSSPGYPYITQGFSTNGQVLGVENGVPSESSLRLIWGILSKRLKNRDSDPIRFFVKPEPHSTKKLAQRRARLISSVSVVDQIIDHMLFDGENEVIMSNWLRTPPKVGWSPLKGGWKLVPQYKVVAADKSGWDWTVQPWLVELLEASTKSMCLNPTSYWLDLVSWRYKELFHHPVFVLGSGALFQQQFVGMMKSGCVQTIISNSKCQMFLNYRVCAELGMKKPSQFWCMGDDTLQSDMPQAYWEKLGEYCILKQVEHKAEFAGMIFDGFSVNPSYLSKHAFNLLYHDKRYREEMGLSYYLLYHRALNRQQVLPLLRELAAQPSEDWLDDLYDN